VNRVCGLATTLALTGLVVAAMGARAARARCTGRGKRATGAEELSAGDAADNGLRSHAPSGAIRASAPGPWADEGRLRSSEVAGMAWHADNWGNMSEPIWLTVARELQAVAQTGLAYTQDVFDRERYDRIRTLAATLMAERTGSDMEMIVGLFRQDLGYATPKVDVRGAAFIDGRILMVREVSDGMWSLPGGWADVNQSAAECIVREIEEESGFKASALKLAAIWDYRKHGYVSRHPSSIYKVFFICEITGGAARPSNETSEVGFFSRNSLPALSHGRITATQIHRMFDHADHLATPTDFD
jgi:ADP-ribose pyrophosphatase YjhB (NUDIX family)